MRRESGASLVEAVVASVLLSVGVLAVLATARATTRLEALGRWSAGAAELAAARAGALAADPCAAFAGAGTSSGPLAVSWSVGAGGSLRTLDLVVAYPAASGQLPANFAAAFLCLQP
jgi:Tfp pilus assembly protein PilV